MRASLSGLHKYSRGAIFRSDVDGGHKLQLMPDPFQGGVSSWSPNGKQIAFIGSRPGEPKRAYIMSADGSEVRKLTNGECGRDGESDAAWSPDGASIVFGCNPIGPKSGLDHDHLVLRIVDLKTGTISILPGSQGLWAPRFTPQGRYVVTHSYPQPQKLMLYDLRTHSQRDLFAEPDGSVIATRSTGTWEIYAIDWEAP